MNEYNNRYLPSKETLSKILYKDEIHYMKYSIAFANIDLGIRVVYTNQEDDYPSSEDCINVWELVAKIKEYLLMNKKINILTDYDVIEKKWAAMAVRRGEVVYSYAYINEAEILVEETADTEYEAIFKIADMIKFDDDEEE